MKRTSPNYVRFLEHAVKALLDERAKTHDELAPVPAEHGSEIVPAHVRGVVSQAEAQVATIEWVDEKGIGVPEAFARQAPPGTWILIEGDEIEVQETVKTDRGPCLIISFNVVGGVTRQLRPGMIVELD